MSRQAIAQIEKAEETARSILLEAQKSAREELNSANQLAAQRLADAKRQLTELTNQAVERQKAIDEAYAAEQLEKVKQQCEQLEELTAERIEKAVIQVMERVMN